MLHNHETGMALLKAKFLSIRVKRAALFSGDLPSVLESFLANSDHHTGILEVGADETR